MTRVWAIALLASNACMAQTHQECAEVIEVFNAAALIRQSGVPLAGMVQLAYDKQRADGVPEVTIRKRVELFTQGYQYEGSIPELSRRCYQQADARPTIEQQQARAAYFSCLATRRAPDDQTPNSYQICGADPYYFVRRDAQRDWNRQTAPSYDCHAWPWGVTCDPR